MAQGRGGYGGPQAHLAQVGVVEAAAPLGLLPRAAALGVPPGVPGGGTEGGDALGQLWAMGTGGQGGWGGSGRLWGSPGAPSQPLDHSLTCSWAQAPRSSWGRGQQAVVMAPSSSGTGRLRAPTGEE